nr:hypothetical protein [Tanacetum cinerariifolium]
MANHILYMAPSLTETPSSTENYKRNTPYQTVRNEAQSFNCKSNIEHPHGYNHIPVLVVVSTDIGIAVIVAGDAACTATNLARQPLRRHVRQPFHIGQEHYIRWTYPILPSSKSIGIIAIPAVGDLKLEKKFRELCEEVSNVVKEKEDVVEELESLSSNHVAKKIARLLRRGMLMYFDHENRKDIAFANGLHNLWAELLERTNERGCMACVSSCTITTRDLFRLDDLEEVCKTRTFALGDKPHSFFAPEGKPLQRGLNPRPLACGNNLPKPFASASLLWLVVSLVGELLYDMELLYDREFSLLVEIVYDENSRLVDFLCMNTPYLASSSSSPSELSSDKSISDSSASSVSFALPSTPMLGVFAGKCGLRSWEWCGGGGVEGRVREKGVLQLAGKPIAGEQCIQTKHGEDGLVWGI